MFEPLCKSFIIARIVKFDTWCVAKGHTISQMALTQYHPWKGVTSPGAALFGDVLQPAGSSAASSQSKVEMTSAPILTSSSSCTMCSKFFPFQMLTGDLDSSLANLASNLDFGNGAKKWVLSLKTKWCSNNMMGIWSTTLWLRKKD